MEMITLKDFFEKQGYGKGKRINVSVFAEITGVSVSYISKLLNGRPLGSPNTKTFKKVSDYVENYGYRLITSNPLDYAESNISRENNRLKKENLLLKAEIERLNGIIEDYSSITKLCNKIVKETNENGKRNYKTRSN